MEKQNLSTNTDQDINNQIKQLINKNNMLANNHFNINPQNFNNYNSNISIFLYIIHSYFNIQYHLINQFQCIIIKKILLTLL